MTTTTINWRPYSQAQQSAAESYRRKTAPKNDLATCAALAARNAMSGNRRIYLIATYSGYALSNSEPPFGQKALVFEKDRYGELSY